MLLIRPKTPPQLPVLADALRPDAFTESAADRVARTEVLVGNQAAPAGDLFHFSGDPRDGRWRLEGDCSSVHRLAAGMAAGELHVEGPIGDHTAARITGGRVTIAGAAGDWLGAEMRGGQIEATGDVGHRVGAAYRDSLLGMRGGRIVVHGDAGDEVGALMRRGLIVVNGACGELVGFRMRAGTILVLKAAGRRAGAEMVRGTIGLFGEARPRLPPTFRYACDFEPAFLGPLASQAGVALPTRVSLFSGDLLCGGRGEVLTPS